MSIQAYRCKHICLFGRSHMIKQSSTPVYIGACNSTTLPIFNALRKNFMYYPRYPLPFRGPRAKPGSEKCGVCPHIKSLVSRLKSRVLLNYYE